MAAPANAAVRERRRRSTPLDLERMNVMKALTAAEHSRRQFILNFAASIDTQLLVPGQKSNAVKAAEEWVALQLAQDGYQAVNSDFFKYSVDVRLWSTHVGNDLEFPFAFMRGKGEAPSSDSSEADYKDVNSEALAGQENDIRKGEVISMAASPQSFAKSSQIMSPRKQQFTPLTPQTRRQRSITTPGSADNSVNKRSWSLNTLDELNDSKTNQGRFPFLVRLGRSWSRRRSAAT
ncbi:hypothetical protein N657DRAFT_91018 [Parathielavia appendiculata]|uniref:Uncharacterized protein n=1 Tax=Parathielavia appendiculata TaxID=2587402 RepID=A0AAN6UB23_9PEZI|nr:hypothetical protein N657DRAFT_91018 [Parathielavia appendiculata]